MCVEAAAIMLVQSEVFDDVDKAKEKAYEALTSGAALAKLKEMIKAQHGDPSVVDNIKLLPKSKERSALLAKKSGYISKIHTQQLGLSAMALGAGRKTKEDPINYGVGLILTVKVGDFINKDDVLCMVYHDEPLDQDYLDHLSSTFEIKNEATASSPLIDTVLS